MSEKLDMQSPNWANLNSQFIAERFPNCVTESADGIKIDFDLLKQELSNDLIEGTKERYRLEWPGKKEAIVTANLPTTKTLRPIREDSVDFDNTENIYIEGDNLEVLKLLQESYLGKIKMIYIDPPYNTGNDFVYKDNFAKNAKDELHDSGQMDSENQKLVANPETAGRYHSDWLSMMYPRLKLSRNLLKDDGVIFISCDENEHPRLRQILDEIFGQQNLIADLVWAAGKKNDSKYISISHEYIIVYAKNVDYIKQNKIIWRQKKKGLDSIYKEFERLKKIHKNDFQLISGELKAWFKNLPDNNPAKAHKHYSNVDSKGIYFPDNISWPGGGGPMYDVLHPTTNKPVKIPSRGWITGDQNKMKEWIADDLVDFGEDENKVPCMKSYLKNREFETPYSVFYQDGRASSKRLREIFGSDVFDFPKDELILKDLIEMISSNSEDIILDFFSGSATTGHAVQLINSTDLINRKYILVQIPEVVKKDSIAFKEGFVNICEIGKERIRRTAKKIKEETNADIDYGFRVYRLSDSNMQDVYYKPQDYKQASLELFSDNVKTDRTSDDLLAQVMLVWGLPLSLKIEQVEISGKQVFKVAENSLYACFDKNIDEEFAKELASSKPLRVVFRDAGFKDDTAKTNVKQLLKQLSPETEMKVI